MLIVGDSWTYILFSKLEKNADSEKAKRCAKYMRNQVFYLG